MSRTAGEETSRSDLELQVRGGVLVQVQDFSGLLADLLVCQVPVARLVGQEE